ncbi:MAG: DUF2809 domain-containing protein [Acidobacteria bacterium]|nr:DUF2809 domain-containing protein [Acidobacteriota bacterium]
MTFNLKYLLLTAALLLTEIAIALFVRDAVVRPFVGDALVVVLIYCFVRIFTDFSYWKTALGVLAFAFLIEILQYFDYVRLLGLENNRVLSVMLGRTFEWTDFAAYAAGAAAILFFERMRHNKD